MKYSDELTGNEFSFTGKVLTWADLEKAIGNDSIIDGVRASWDYFGFDKRHEWKAVLIGDEAILVTDESRDLNMAGIYPDMDTFILWLDMVNDDRVKEDEKERRFRERQQLEQQEQLQLATA